MTRKLVYTPDASFDGKTVLAFLKANGFSSRLIRDLKNNPHGIMIRNKKVTVLKQLHSGDVITLYIRDSGSASENVTPVDIPIGVVYEDEDIIVVDKPAFMATHPSQDNHDTTLANALAYRFMQSGTPCVIRPVNRLDKNTSGLIIVAKNARASGVLSEALKNREIHREYLAFTEGSPDEKNGVIDIPISRAPDSVIKRTVNPENGERAVTHYTVLKDGELALVRLWLETGRTHQIRVHMSFTGHPVAGDFLYGHEFSFGMKRQALHSYSLDFTHPMTGGKMHFTAPLPEDMSEIYKSRWGEWDIE